MANIPFNRNTIVRCFTTENEQRLNAIDPSRIANLATFENNVQAKIRDNDASAFRKVREFLNVEEVKTIPLVVHVLYNTERENISDAQILSQIEITNQDFARTNPDAVNTPYPFNEVASSTPIQFCLVKIIRQKTDRQSFAMSGDDVKFSDRGGSDSVDTSKYFNVWVCNLTGLLGYGEFPTSRLSDTYGVVVNYEAFGNTGTVRAPYDKGRTLTHEIAHSLNVYHIFDESNTTECKKTDKVYDIPSQSKATKGCPSFPYTEKCAFEPPGIMFMNYMDYTDDRCMNCFTKEQAKRMIATLETAPYNNLAKTGCSPLSQIPVSSSMERKQRRNLVIWIIISIVLIVALFLLIKRFAKI